MSHFPHRTGLCVILLVSPAPGREQAQTAFWEVSEGALNSISRGKPSGLRGTAVYGGAGGQRPQRALTVGDRGRAPPPGADPPKGSEVNFEGDGAVGTS